MRRRELPHWQGRFREDTCVHLVRDVGILLIGMPAATTALGFSLAAVAKEKVLRGNHLVTVLVRVGIPSPPTFFRPMDFRMHGCLGSLRHPLVALEATTSFCGPAFFWRAKRDSRFLHLKQRGLAVRHSLRRVYLCSSHLCIFHQMRQMCDGTLRLKIPPPTFHHVMGCMQMNAWVSIPSSHRSGAFARCPGTPTLRQRVLCASILCVRNLSGAAA